MNTNDFFKDQQKKRIIANVRSALAKQFPGAGSGRRLAEAMGVSPATVSRWLSGKKLPDLEQLNRLAKTLGEPLHCLLGYSDDSVMRGKNPLFDNAIKLSILAERIRRGDDPRPRETRQLVKRLKKTIARARSFVAMRE
ncbi:MAG: helix-turn-helix domain-containing protein [Planctomycetota bacterium]|jgi:transcriptional regulator with XRE-family HTH domain|nr:helix-turn-helix domain-containing protein [Planctomycetota bacterium]